MTGTFGGEGRTSQEYETRMDVTRDGGKTWRQGNYQIFTRVAPGP
jgi:hypothetical protein